MLKVGFSGLAAPQSGPTRSPMAKYYENLPVKYPWYRMERVTIYQNDGTPYDVQQNFNQGNIIGYATRVGDSLTGWREKIAKGESATTLFRGLKQDAVCVSTPNYKVKIMLDYDWYSINDYQTVNWGHSFEIPQQNLFSASDIAAIGNRALAKLLKRYRGRTSSFQGLVFGGELRETLRMLRSPLKGIVSTLEAFYIDVYRRNGRYKKRDRIKRASDLWLEYSFGLSPLVSDLNDAVSAYNKIGETDPREVVSAYSEQEKVYIAETNGGPACGIGPMIDLLTQRFTCRVRYIVGVKTHITQPGAADKLQRFGLTTQHIAAALWELTPWSFLVDYFTNIGDIIEAGMTDTSGITWGCRTERIVGETFLTRRLDGAAFVKSNRRGSYVISGNPGMLRMSSKSVKRSPAGSLVPSFQLEIPGYSSKWLNMAALGATRIRALRSF